MKTKTIETTLDDGTKVDITTSVNGNENIIGFSLVNNSAIKWEYAMQKHDGTEHYFESPYAVGLYVETRSAAAMAKALRSLADDLESEVNGEQKI